MRLPLISRIVAFLRRRGGDPIRVAESPALRPPAPAQQTDYQLLADNSSDLIIQIGPDGIPVYVSPSCTRLLGWLPEEMIGRGPDAFVGADDFQRIQGSIAQLMAGDENGEKTVEISVRRKDGSALWMGANARLVRDAATGAPSGIVVILRDMSELKRLEEELRSLAMTDGLTGLSNRRAFDQTLEREWARTVRSHGQISLLLLDVDRFKGFNDLYGHQVGDDCLRAVAAAMRRVLQRPADMAARYGGEELAVILPDTDGDGAMEIAERMRRAIEELGLPHSENPEGGGRVTVSVGCATALSRSGGTMRMPEGLLLAADTALYKAKHRGRNRVESALILAPESHRAA